MKPLASLIRRHLPISPIFKTAAEPDPSRGGAEGRQTQQREAPSGDSKNQSAKSVPTSGFELINSSTKLEEETYSWHSVKSFYPAAIGEILNNTYQVIAKLGYGSASTTWLCRDLRNHRYVTIKIYATGEAQTAREVIALKHINWVLANLPPNKHLGARSIRTLIDQFEIPRPASSRLNLCLIFEPLSMSVGDVRKLLYDGRMPINMVKSVAFYVLQALDFLRRKAKLVHADIKEDNIIFAAAQNSEWRQFEDAEMAEPSPRKVYKHHAIYSSRVSGLPTPSIPVLCDFGEARFGKESYGEHAMPDLYRAPEILLRIEWAEKIDIWALGLVLWALTEGTNFFNDNKGGRWKSALPHMARMVSLLGPLPQDLLDLTPVSREFFDKSGRLRKGHQVIETPLEAEATALEGEAKASFLRFLRRILQWDADKRPSAQELLKDPWLVISQDDSESEEGRQEDASQ